MRKMNVQHMKAIFNFFFLLVFENLSFTFNHCFMQDSAMVLSLSTNREGETNVEQGGRHS